jgi:hypothetical protein
VKKSCIRKAQIQREHEVKHAMTFLPRTSEIGTMKVRGKRKYLVIDVNENSDDEEQKLTEYSPSDVNEG